MSYNLLFIATGSPWKNSLLKCWQHQDAVLKAFCDKHDTVIHIGIPIRGATYFEKLLEGKDSRVMTGWKRLPYRVYDHLYDGEYDGVVLELAAFFSDIELPGGQVVDASEVNLYVANKCIEAMDADKPILMFDPDGYSIRGLSLKDKDNQLKHIFNMCKNYHKFTLVTPFEFGLGHEGVHEEFMPYNFDVDTLPTEIVPMSQRQFITRYVGNNFHRDNFVPYFKELAKYGTVEVYGKNWGSYEADNPEVIWGTKFAFTEERAYPFLSQALIGLYGTVPVLAEKGHYTLRVREYAQAGVFIIPECDYMYSHMMTPIYPVSISDIFDSDEMHSIMSLDNEQYETLVLDQQEVLCEFFDARKYVHIYEESLLGGR